jgi:hypothetical protein
LLELNVAWRGVVLAVLVSAIVAVSTHPDVVSSAIAERLFPRPEPVVIPVKPFVPSPYGIPSVVTEQAVADYLKVHKYVSNYDVEMPVVQLSNHVETGGRLRFHLSIKDTGINKLSEKKYFWIVVFNPDGNLAGVFPSMDGSPISAGTKWQAPRVPLPYNYTVLFNGDIDGQEIQYEFSIPDDSSSIGTWKTYVLVFDDTYLDRWGKAIACGSTTGAYYCPIDLDNTVGYTLMNVDVSAKSLPVVPSLANASPWIAIVASFVFTYFAYSKRTQKIDDMLGKLSSAMKKHWFFILVLLVLMSCILLQFLEMKCVPIPIP